MKVTLKDLAVGDRFRFTGLAENVEAFELVQLTPSAIIRDENGGDATVALDTLVRPVRGQEFKRLADVPRGSIYWSGGQRLVLESTRDVSTIVSLIVRPIPAPTSGSVRVEKVDNPPTLQYARVGEWFALSDNTVGIKLAHDYLGLVAVKVHGEPISGLPYDTIVTPAARPLSTIERIDETLACADLGGERVLLLGEYEARKLAHWQGIKLSEYDNGKCKYKGVTVHTVNVLKFCEVAYL